MKSMKELFAEAEQEHAERTARTAMPAGRGRVPTKSMKELFAEAEQEHANRAKIVPGTKKTSGQGGSPVSTATTGTSGPLSQALGEAQRQMDKKREVSDLQAEVRQARGGRAVALPAYTSPLEEARAEFAQSFTLPKATEQDDLRAEVRQARGGRAVNADQDRQRWEASVKAKADNDEAVLAHMEQRHAQAKADLEILRKQRDALNQQADDVEDHWAMFDYVPPDRQGEAEKFRSQARAVGRDISSKATERDDLATKHYQAKMESQTKRLYRSPEDLHAFRALRVLTGHDDLINRVGSALEQGQEPKPEDEALLEELFGLRRDAYVSQQDYLNAMAAVERSGDYLGKGMEEPFREQLARAGYSVDQINDLYDYATRYETAQAAAKRQEEAARFAKDHPVLASAASVGAMPFQGIDYLWQGLRGWGKSDTDDLDTYRPLDPNEMTATQFVQDIRGTVSKEIEENTDWEVFGTNVASFLYNIGMSMADSAAMVSTTGPASIYFMGANAAAQTSYDIMQRGGTNNQAMLGGLAAGVAEALFEKVSVDNLLNPNRTVKGWRDLVRETAIQAGVEGSEEVFTEIANILSDTAIMGEKSNLALAVKNYQEQGMNAREATRKAYLDLLGGVALAGVGGAISGAGMGGTVSALNYMGNRGGAVDAKTDEGGSIQFAGKLRTYKETVEFEAAKGQGIEDYKQVNSEPVRGEAAKLRGDLLTYKEQVDSDAGILDQEELRQKKSTQERVENSGIIPFDHKERIQLSSSKGVVAGGKITFREFIDKAKQLGNAVRFYFGKVSPALGERMQQDLGRDLTGRNIVIRTDEILHSFRSHGNEAAEALRGQIAVTPELLERLPEVFDHPEEIAWTKKRDYAGRSAFEIKKEINGYMVAVLGIADGRNSIEVDSVRIQKRKGPLDTADAAVIPPSLTPETSTKTTSSDKTIPQAQQESNTNFAEDEYFESLMKAEPEEEPYFEPETEEAAQAAVTAVQEVLNDFFERNASRIEDSAFLATVEDLKDRGRLRTFKETLEEEKRIWRRRLVDVGDTVDKIGRELKDPMLYAVYNYARASSNAAGSAIRRGGAQVNTMGKRVGESLADLFEPIRSKGEDYYRDFQQYLYHRHNVDRMSRDNTARVFEIEEAIRVFKEGDPETAMLRDEELHTQAAQGDPEAQVYLKLLNELERAKAVRKKPVFGDEVTAEISANIVTEYELSHPEFLELAEKIYQYNRNLMDYRVDSGLLSREQADHIQKVYPHYVPVFRVQAREGRKIKRQSIGASSTVAKATGGDSKIIPLHIAMARQTQQVYRESGKNRVAQYLLNLLSSPENREFGKKYIYKVAEAAPPTEDTFDVTESNEPRHENTFIVREDGKAWEMTLEQGLYEGLEALDMRRGRIESSWLYQGGRELNTLFKALVTGSNPIFTAKNAIRDLQEAGLYSKDAVAWAKNYPLAVKEIAQNGHYWQLYQAMGGVYSSIFDYNIGYLDPKKDHGALRRNTVDKVEAINMAVEQAPRLAEFMAQVKKHGEDNMESLMNAALAAANVTTNFGRSGSWGRHINQTFVPFFNPAVQGLDKMVRTFLGKKTGKDWLKLVAKCAVLGILPSAVNNLLNAGAPGWDDIRDSDKDTYWMFHIGDGKYLRLPKGRDISTLIMAIDRAGDALRGEEVDLWGTLKTAANQIAPPNPLENNILAAWLDADLFDDNSPGKTWYGADIESQRLQGYAPSERYDTKTSEIAKGLGKVLNKSPKKIHYLLDQYTGVLGDFLLPMTTPAGDKNPLAPFINAFTLDSTTSNKINGEFYDAGDRITYAKNSGDGPMRIVSKWWNKQVAAANDIYQEIRELEGSTLPNAEKQAKIREAKAVLNGIQKNALELLPAYEEQARQSYISPDDASVKVASIDANRKMFGAAYAIHEIDTDLARDAARLERRYGVSQDDFLTAYRAQQGITGDKDGYGDPIQLSKSAKVKAAIDQALPELERSQKEALYEQFGVSKRMWRVDTSKGLPKASDVFFDLADAGVESDTAYKIAEEVGGMKPALGKERISDWQKARAVVNNIEDYNTQMGALETILDESDYKKISAAKENYVVPAIYIAFKEQMGAIKVNQDNVESVLNGMMISKAQKAVLWQLANTGWKPGNNPYDPAAGEEALKIYKMGNSRHEVNVAPTQKGGLLPKANP